MIINIKVYMMKEVLIFGALNKEELDVVEAKNYEMKLTNKHAMSISEDILGNEHEDI